MNTFQHTMKHVFLSYTFHIAYLSLAVNVRSTNMISSSLINGQDQLLYVHQTHEHQTHEASFELNLRFMLNLTK